MLADRQRNGRTRLQEPRCGGLVGPLLLVLWVQTGEAGRLWDQRPPKAKRQDRQHAAAERQEGGEALAGLGELDTPRGDRDAACEAMAEAFDALGVAAAPARRLPRPPLP